MRAYVLTDARLAKLAGRFVWLDVDTEKPRNLAFLEKFPVEVWPTLLVIDPTTEKVVLRWTGAATAEQIERLALDAERALHAGEGGGAPGTGKADAALARADRLSGERRPADAAAVYREALARGGKHWEPRERAAESLVQSLGLTEDAASCAAAAQELLPSLAPGARAARVAAQGLTCALSLDDPGERATAVIALEPLARASAAAPGVLADDRSWLFDELSQAREAMGDLAGATREAKRWLSFIVAKRAKAPTALARSGFDGQLLAAAIRAGEPRRALPALIRSERELPDDFVPAQNLARLYLELGRPADALPAAKRAAAKAEGPRRVRILVLEAQALGALGRKEEERAVLDEAVRTGEELPGAARPTLYVTTARKMLQELSR